MAFSVEFREEIIRKVLLVNRTDSLVTISNNNGVTTRTIRRWIKSYQKVLGDNAYLAKDDKVSAVLLTINLPFEDKAVFCRKNSGIKFVTPYQRHHGLEKEVLTRRQQVYQAARLKMPQRWSTESRNWQPVKEVAINPIG